MMRRIALYFLGGLPLSALVLAACTEAEAPSAVPAPARLAMCGYFNHGYDAGAVSWMINTPAAPCLAASSNL